MESILIIKNIHADNSVFDKSNLHVLAFLQTRSILSLNLNWMFLDTLKTLMSQPPQMIITLNRKTLNSPSVQIYKTSSKIPTIIKEVPWIVR